MAQSLDSLLNVYDTVTGGRVEKIQREICYELSFNDLETAKIIAAKYRISPLLIDAYLDRGNEFSNKGFHIFAKQFYSLAYDLADDLNDDLGLAKSYNALGLLSLDLGDNDEANKQLKRSLQLYQELADKEGEARVLMHLGLVLKSQNKYSEALETLKSSLTIEIKENHYIGIVEVLNEIGEVYVLLGKSDKAIEFYKQAIIIIEELKDESLYAYTYNKLAAVYFSQENYEECISICKKTIFLGEDKKSKEDERDAYKLISDTYFALELYEDAYRNYVKFEKLTKELVDHNYSKGLKKLKSQLETQAQDKQTIINEEVDKIESKLEIQNNILYIVLFALMIVVAAMMVYIFSQKSKYIEAKNLLLKVQHEIDRIIKEQEDDHYQMDNKLLSINSINAHIKNELLKNIGSKLEDLVKRPGTVKKGDLKALMGFIEGQVDTTNDWERFKENFEQLHEGFFDRLNTKCPDLTPGDMKLCAFIRVQLDTKDIASLLGITPDSVVKKRNRLRKRLEVDSETDLQDYMIRI